MENRRNFLQRTAFGLAALSVAGTARAATAPGQPAPPSESAHWLLAPLKVGDEIGLGWSLARVYPPVLGAVTLNLVHIDGRAARVDMSLKGEFARGPASSRFVEFIVMDGGDGDKQLAESVGRVVRKLAAIVESNELQDVDALAALEPHADRVLRHHDAMSQASKRLEPGLG